MLAASQQTDPAQQSTNSPPKVQIYTCNTDSSGSFEALGPGGSCWLNDGLEEEPDVVAVEDMVAQLVSVILFLTFA